MGASAWVFLELAALGLCSHGCRSAHGGGLGGESGTWSV